MEGNLEELLMVSKKLVIWTENPLTFSPHTLRWLQITTHYSSSWVHLFARTTHPTIVCWSNSNFFYHVISMNRILLRYTGVQSFCINCCDQRLQSKCAHAVKSVPYAVLRWLKRQWFFFWIIKKEWERKEEWRTLLKSFSQSQKLIQKLENSEATW